MHFSMTRRRLASALGLAPLGCIATAPAAAPESWQMPDEAAPHRATWMSFGPSEAI